MDIDLEAPATEHEDGVWFTPDFGGNLDLPESDRAAVCYVPLTGRDLIKIDSSQLVRSKKGQRAVDLIGVLARREEAKKERVLRTHVVGLRNWFVRTPDGTRTEIKDIAALMETLLVKRRSGAATAVKLFNDIFDAIVGGSEIDETLLGE